MVKHFSLTILILTVAIALMFCACAKKEKKIIGDSTIHKFQNVAGYNLYTKYFTYMDTWVKSDLIYYAKHPQSPRKDFCLLETRQDYGKIWILADCEKYSKIFSKIKRGEKFTVYGQASSISREGKTEAEIAIIAQ